MDVTLLSPSSIKIKGKHATLIVDPDSVKTSADIVLILEKNKLVDAEKIKVEGYRLIIQGAGEYEVQGVKITSEMAGQGDLIYNITIDNTEVLLAKTSSLSKFSNKSIVESKDYQILILEADQTIDSAIIAKISPKAVLFYGDKKEDLSKEFGESAKKINKYSVTLEKLPEEMEVMLLATSS